MYLLNTPPRQDRWREHLAQLEREATEGEIQTVLSLLLNILADPSPSQELETWLFHALVGEHRRLQERLDVDEALDDQYKGICEQIQTRLSRGEPPLP